VGEQGVIPGDFIGDHRLIREGPHRYNALTKVPLLIRWPGEITSESSDEALPTSSSAAPYELVSTTPWLRHRSDAISHN
jgi:hypothetical protein